MNNINFVFIDRFLERLHAAQSESDSSYFYDLILLGEAITKITALFLIANINNDKDRNRYRQEYALVRAGGIGDFSNAINEVLTGIPSGFLSSSLSDYEIAEMNNKIKPDSWQKVSITALIESLSIFQIQHTNVTAKTPFRIWFNLFALLRNKTKGHGAPRIAQCSQASKYLSQSLAQILENLTLFKRPWAFLYRNLNGKYRVTNISINCSAFDKLKRTAGYNYEDGVYCFTDTIRKVNLLYSDPELTNFFLPNGNFRDKTFETISYIDDQKQQFDTSSYLTPASKLPASITEGQDNLNVVSDCFSNVPKAPEEYIERKELEDELTSILLDKERFPVVTLKGRGGIGKTSLAIKVIHSISKGERFEIIIWFSARDVDLFPEGPKQVQSKVLTKEDISDEYCRLVHPNKCIKDTLTVFSKAMSHSPFGPTLFVLDNFETITNPAEVFEWLNTYIRNPNKILITSRMSRNFKADYPIEVSGMNDAQCRELINHIANKYDISHLISPQYIEDLIQESNGHPYIIKIIMGEIARTRKTSKVERVIADKDQILNALFRRTFQTLSPAAKRVFLTLCSWNSLVPIVAIEAVLWRNDNEKIDVEGAIDELQKSSFIELLEENNETFIQVPLAASLYGKTELSVYPEKIQIQDDRTLLMEFGASNPHSVKRGIAPRIESKFQKVAQRVKTPEEFQKELPSLEYIASRYPKAWLYIANFYKDYNDHEGAKRSLRELLKVTSLSVEKEKYWFEYANLCKKTNDWNGESMALLEIATIPNVPFCSISNCANRINNHFYRNPYDKQVDSKYSLFSKLASVMSKRITEGDATDYSRLAWLYLNIDDEINAKKYMEQGLNIDSCNSHCLKLQQRLC